jgi:serpin B
MWRWVSDTPVSSCKRLKAPGVLRATLRIGRTHGTERARETVMRSSLPRPVYDMTVALGLALAAAGVVACGGANRSSGSNQDYGVVQSPLARNTSPQVASSDLQTLVSNNTTFAFALYHQLATGNESDNLFYSPYSVSIALAMTYAGAGSSTATQMAGALDFQLPSSSLHPAFDAVDLQLASRAHGQAGDNGQPFKLNVVDSLWADRTFTFQKPFLDTLAQYYGAGLRTVDFENAPATARGSINGWVSDQTAKLVPQLLPEGSIDASTRFVIVNAIYFNAGWQSPFMSSSTLPVAFTHLDGSRAQVPMMKQSLETGYASGSNWQAAELRYAGAQTSMVIVLPQQGQFPQVEHGLDATFTSSVFSSLQNTEVTFSMPKFSIQGATISLATELRKLGMTDAFDQAKADFSGMTHEPVFISDVLHQAYVSVDENGTQAAAATAVIGETTSVPGNSATMTVDRPFFIVIRDIPTSSVLFVGRVLSP